ncbi:Cytochrome c oxidase copper chaperone [Frankliniella fusca]|uniref:Cytochrome c oxidase copper chaperone n=1 Tax=Frankliniella fusca TaxID=407009 RepID=A0AAE1HDD3_9NEOP|nr:Cytochrome c oxidase copper chaperone [Frankliniella fusca]
MLERLGLSSIMGSPSAQTEPEKPAATEKPKCKACCACPETKKARDECVIEKGESECGDLIEAHKKCMRSLGFKI